MDAKRRPCASPARRAAGKIPHSAGLAVAALLAAIPAAPARAQLLPEAFPPTLPGYGTDPGVTVQTRARPAFDSLGTRIGGALIHARIEQSAGFDSDVLGAGAGRGSWLIRTAPSILIDSTARRDPYGLYLSLDDTRYPSLPAQGRTDWTAVGGTTLALGDGSLTLGAAHLALHQSPGDLDALPTDQPIAYQVNDLRAGYALSLGRLTLEPSLDFAAWRFGDATILGVPTRQTYRDRDVVQGGLTFRYEVAPRRSLVLALRGAGQLYVATPATAASLNSDSLAVLVGIDDATDGLWHYRLLGGYERRDFADAAYRTHGAAVAEADAIFTPDGMTTLTATLARRIEDAAQEGVAGFVYTSAKLTTDYEWRRNVLLQASVGVQRADLLGGGGRQTALQGGIGATWLLNRRVRLVGSYDVADVHGSGTRAAGLAGDFVRSLALLTLRLGL